MVKEEVMKRVRVEMTVPQAEAVTKAMSHIISYASHEERLKFFGSLSKAEAAKNAFWESEAQLMRARGESPD